MTARYHRPIVVTGTGTDVGKTYVTAALLRALRDAQLAPRALKPVETGYVEAQSDALALASAAGHELVRPMFTAPDPVSPHRAARGLDLELRAADVAAWVRNHQVEARGPLLVETAGGLFSPLNDDETMLDVVKALEPCVFVVVALDRLGTLHDVLATHLASRAHHRIPDATILNLRQPNQLENAAELRRLGLRTPVFETTRAESFLKLAQDLLALSERPIP